MNRMTRLLPVACALSFAACGSTPAQNPMDLSTTQNPDLTRAADLSQIADMAGVTQTPPITGQSDIEAWIALGYYKSWHCEPAPHAARSPSPHGINRICSNDVLSATASNAEYPVGSAAVKELYAADMVTITGYAMYRHLSLGMTGDGGTPVDTGADWYYYERTGMNLVAVGTGDSGTPLSICVACHKAAGSDANHSGHDFVYTQVK